jgi:alpha-tubulin suppressor-like RCC1 family protein
MLSRVFTISTGLTALVSCGSSYPTNVFSSGPDNRKNPTEEAIVDAQQKHRQNEQPKSDESNAGERSPTSVETESSNQEAANPQSLEMPPPELKIRDFSTGRCHVCATDFSGRTWCWGCGVDQNLATTITTTPRQVTDISSPKSLEAMDVGTCALMENGDVRCWGSKYVRESAHKHASGMVHSSPADCAIKQGGKLYCSGLNRRGRLGTPADFGRHPQGAVLKEKMVDLPTSIKDAFVGDESGCALTEDGKVYCWGLSYGCEGPIPIDLPDDIVALDGGGRSVCFLNRTHSVYQLSVSMMHINGEDHQCYQDDPNYYRLLKPIVENAESVACNDMNGCIIRGNGEAACWGNPSGPSPELRPDTQFMKTIEGLPPIQKVDVGTNFACALTLEHQLLCWGYNASGALGRGFQSMSWEAVPAEPSWQLVDSPANAAGANVHVFHLQNGRVLSIENKQASIFDKNDRVLCTNKTLIRLQDEYFNCMSDGFRSVKNKKDGFVLEQQSCSNTYIISETIEFRFSRKGDEVYLYRFDLEYMDKFTDAHESKFYRLTAKDFGKIRFEDVNFDRLYELAWAKEK